MTEKTLRFGILGCGTIAGFHAKAIEHLPNAVLTGAADHMPAFAEAFAQKHHITAYATYEQMLADSTIDAVCICTPSGFHKENALAALVANKHVVLEKPMAFTKEEAKEIADACRKHGRVLTVISQLRFSEDIQKVKALVEDNAFGQLVFCDLYMKYWRSEEYYASSDWKGTLRFDGGGALMNQGIHGVDILLYLAGDAKVLSAKNRTVYHNIEVEDQSVAMLEFENGALGVIEASTCSCPGFERRIELIGTKGSVVLKEGSIESLVVQGKPIECGKVAVAGTANDPTAMDFALHAMQLGNFIAAVFGEEPLRIDAKEGSRAVSLIEEIYRH